MGDRDATELAVVVTGSDLGTLGPAPEHVGGASLFRLPPLARGAETRFSVGLFLSGPGSHEVAIAVRAHDVAEVDLGPVALTGVAGDPGPPDPVAFGAVPAAATASLAPIAAQPPGTAATAPPATGLVAPAFSAPVTLGADDPRYRGGEPTLQVGPTGTLWLTEVGPAQIWRSTDGGASWASVPPPLANGGDDLDAAEDGRGRLHVVDQSHDCGFYYRSSDGGGTFERVQATRGGGRWIDAPGDCQRTGSLPFDRGWVRTFGPDVVYIADKESGHTAVEVSSDGGDTFTYIRRDTGEVSGAAIDPLDGTLYLLYQEGGAFDAQRGAMVQPSVLADATLDGGRTFTTARVVDRPGHDVGGGFATAAVDRDHNVYVAWSDDSDGTYQIYLSASRDHGRTWSAPLRVSSPRGANVYPTVVAGDPGRVAVAWYGTSDPARSRSDAPDARWSVYVALTVDALALRPTLVETTVAPTPFHRGPICAHVSQCDGYDTTKAQLPPGYEAGIADFFGMTLARDGPLVVAWTDTGGGRPKDMVARQVAGTRLSGR
ncbi:MAG: hypothetical protein KGN00_08835 [Chloroflexota bacterium]|nr:hypothetical protein [Chloroflexota bacterium]